MKEYSKTFIITMLMIGQFLLAIGLLFPIVSLGVYFGLNDNPTGYFPFVLILSFTLIIFAWRSLPIFRKVKSLVLSNQKLLIITVAFFIIQFSILKISYNIYRTRPEETYVLADEIHKRHDLNTKKGNEDLLQITKQSKSQIAKEEKTWKSLAHLIATNKDRNLNMYADLIMTDSLILSFDQVFQPPGSGGASYRISFYNEMGRWQKNEYCGGGRNVEAAINQKLESFKLSALSYEQQLHGINKSLSDYRYSFQNFASFYIRGQLQPMINTVQLLDWLFLIVFWLYSIVVSIILGSTLVNFLSNGLKKTDNN